MGKNKFLLPPVKLQKMNEVHTKEMEVLKSLYSAIENNAPTEKIDRLFNEFIEDVKQHFSVEEELMRKYHYPEYPMHAGDHDTLLHDLRRLKEDWEETKNPQIIKDFIDNEFLPWINTHINVMDMMTSIYLSQFER